METKELRELVGLRVRRIDLVSEPANQRYFLAVKGDLDEEMLEELEVQKAMGRTTTNEQKVQKDAAGGAYHVNVAPTAQQQAQPQPEPHAQAASADGGSQTTAAQPVDKAAQLTQALREIYDVLAKHAASWPQEAKDALQRLAQIIAGNYQYAYPAPATGSAQKSADKGQGEALKAADVEAAIKAALDPVRQALEALQKSVEELAQKAADLDARLTHIEELRGVRKSAAGQQTVASTKSKSIWANILGPY